MQQKFYLAEICIAEIFFMQKFVCRFCIFVCRNPSAAEICMQILYAEICTQKFFGSRNLYAVSVFLYADFVCRNFFAAEICKQILFAEICIADSVLQQVCNADSVLCRFCILYYADYV